MIDTQALRKKILDAAISGKLTQQLPGDGNADDVYKEIQREKQKSPGTPESHCSKG